MENVNVRTDLALELNEAVDKSDSRYSGVMVRERIDPVSSVKVTTLEILNEEGEKLFNREAGTYVTLEADELGVSDEIYSERVVELLSIQIGELLKPCVKNNSSVLVIGLGNREVTADSLGPCVVERLLINRHLSRENLHGEEHGNITEEAKEKSEGGSIGEGHVLKLSALTPGVMAQTGIETAQIIKGIVRETKPGIVIAIDALAARNTERLNTTVQLSNRGINPGSGVGNHRVGITYDSIGVPVLAIGVPTVIDAATIVSDVTKDWSKVPKHLADMYVTPKDVDACVRTIAEIIADSINKVVYSW